MAKSVVFGGTIYFSLILFALTLKAPANFVLASAAAPPAAVSFGVHAAAGHYRPDLDTGSDR